MSSQQPMSDDGTQPIQATQPQFQYAPSLPPQSAFVPPPSPVPSGVQVIDVTAKAATAAQSLAPAPVVGSMSQMVMPSMTLSPAIKPAVAGATTAVHLAPPQAAGAGAGTLGLKPAASPKKSTTTGTTTIGAKRKAGDAAGVEAAAAAQRIPPAAPANRKVKPAAAAAAVAKVEVVAPAEEDATSSPVAKKPRRLGTAKDAKPASAAASAAADATAADAAESDGEAEGDGDDAEADAAEGADGAEEGDGDHPMTDVKAKEPAVSNDTVHDEGELIVEITEAAKAAMDAVLQHMHQVSLHLQTNAAYIATADAPAAGAKKKITGIGMVSGAKSKESGVHPSEVAPAALVLSEYTPLGVTSLRFAMPVFTDGKSGREVELAIADGDFTLWSSEGQTQRFVPFGAAKTGKVKDGAANTQNNLKTAPFITKVLPFALASRHNEFNAKGEALLDVANRLNTPVKYVSAPVSDMIGLLGGCDIVNAGDPLFKGLVAASKKCTEWQSTLKDFSDAEVAKVHLKRLKATSADAQVKADQLAAGSTKAASHHLLDSLYVLAFVKEKEVKEKKKAVKDAKEPKEVKKKETLQYVKVFGELTKKKKFTAPELLAALGRMQEQFETNGGRPVKAAKAAKAAGQPKDPEAKKQQRGHAVLRQDMRDAQSNTMMDLLQGLAAQVAYFGNRNEERMAIMFAHAMGQNISGALLEKKLHVNQPVQPMAWPSIKIPPKPEPAAAAAAAAGAGAGKKAKGAAAAAASAAALAEAMDESSSGLKDAELPAGADGGDGDGDGDGGDADGDAAAE